MPSELRFTAGQVCSITGAPYHQINYMANRGLVRPSVADGVGSDSCRVYNLADAIAIAAAHRLLKAGIHGQLVSKAVARLKRIDYAEDLGGTLLLIPDDGVAFCESDDLAAQRITETGGVWIAFTIGELAREIIQKAKKVERPIRGKASAAL